MHQYLAAERRLPVNVSTVFPPRGFPHAFVMGDLSREVTFFANSDGFCHGSNEPASFIPNVRDMNSAHCTGDLDQFDDFLGLGKRCGHVKQARAQPKGTIAHALTDEFAHAVEFGGARRAVVVGEHRVPNRPVAYERAKIRRDADASDTVQDRSQGHW